MATTLDKIKADLRISHSALDEDLNDQIAACLKDLRIVGVEDAEETDPIILNALKLWCRANYTADTARAAAYMERYNALKATLMMAEGYGGATDAD